MRSLYWCAVSMSIGLAVFLGGPGTASAITERDDKTDTEYWTLAAQPQYASAGLVTYPSFMWLSGVLIAPDWVLTAGHVVDKSANGSVADESAGLYRFAGVGANRLVLAPGYNGNANYGNDLGLIHLASPLATKPAYIYSGSGELNAPIVSAGMGLSGTGLTGGTSGTNADGRMRAGTNIIDRFGATPTGYLPACSTSDGPNQTMLAWDFDNPSGAINRYSSSAVTSLEGSASLGDSGGPAYMMVGGNPFVIGIHSMVSASDVNHIGKYGDIVYATRVSKFYNFLEDTIGNAWTAVSGGTYSNGASWSDGVPLSEDVVAFNQSATYAVNFTAGATSRKLLVRAGNVTLNLAGNTFAQTMPAADYSVVIGRSAADNATLNLQGGGTLSSVAATLGLGSGSTGAVTLSGAGTQWKVADGLYVGGSSSASGGSGTVTVQSGAALRVNGRMTLWSTGGLTVTTGGNVTVNGTLDGGGSVTVGGGSAATLSAARLRQSNVTLNSAGLISVPQTSTPLGDPGRAAAMVNSVNIISGRINGNGGAWDLKDNDLIVRGSGGMTAAQIQSLIWSGANDSAQNGLGLQTTTASSLAGVTALAVATAGGLGLTTFDGQAVAAGDTLVKYTFAGDADLNGRVDGDDYTMWLAGLRQYNTRHPGYIPSWTDGNFDGNSVVDGDDYSIWLSNLGRSGLSAGGLASGPLTVPEPSMVALISVMMLACFLRRLRGAASPRFRPTPS